MPQRYRPAIYLLRHLYNAVRASVDDALAHTGMTTAEISALAELHGEPGLSNADLARRTFVKPQSMVSVLKSLEKRGWIVREVRPALRSMPARLTPQGIEQLRIGWAAMKSVEERMLDGWTEAERNGFRWDLQFCLSSLGKSRDTSTAR